MFSFRLAYNKVFIMFSAILVPVLLPNLFIKLCFSELYNVVLHRKSGSAK